VPDSHPTRSRPANRKERAVGEALSAIREGKLYRATHGTFEDYCKDKWSMSRIYAHNLITGSAVVESLTMVNKSAITSERQARELSRVEPARREEVVQKAVEATSGKLTAIIIITRPWLTAEGFFVPAPHLVPPEPMKARKSQGIATASFPITSASLLAFR
jgi:hypothetical protein